MTRERRLIVEHRRLKNFEKFERDWGEATPFVRKYMARQKSKRFPFTPWTKAFSNIIGRCIRKTDPKTSFYHGVEVKLKPLDLKALFFRDKGFLMRCPSVDRIDPDGNYDISNVRWIEMDLNRRLRVSIRHPKYAPRYQEFKMNVMGQLKELLTCGWRPKIIRQALCSISKEKEFRDLLL